MTSSFLRRRVSVLLVGSFLLVPWPSPGETLLSHLWSSLTAIWSDAGCTADTPTGARRSPRTRAAPSIHTAAAPAAASDLFRAGAGSGPDLRRARSGASAASGSPPGSGEPSPARSSPRRGPPRSRGRASSRCRPAGALHPRSGKTGSSVVPQFLSIPLPSLLLRSIQSPSHSLVGNTPLILMNAPV
jgi:hypothetical protein